MSLPGRSFRPKAAPLLLFGGAAVALAFGLGEPGRSPAARTSPTSRVGEGTPRSAAQLAPVMHSETHRIPTAVPSSDPLVLPDPVKPLPAPVDVHGCLWLAGAPAPGLDLAFLRQDGHEADWDLSDDDGSFRVRLAPGTYTVEHAGAPDFAPLLVVPTGVAEVAVDFALPTPPLR